MKLRILRIFFSIIIFILFLYVFFVASNLSIIIGDILNSFQFIPSVLKFISTGFSFLASGFILIFLFTIIFGRIYCSFLCPLGILQDFFIFISSRFKKKFSYIKSLGWIRYSILILVIFFSIIGIMVLLNIFDPYSIFSRFLTNIFKPIFSLIINKVVIILKMNKIYLNLFYKIHKINLNLLLFSIISFSVILIFSILKGRLYCNTICPVGTLLGFISKYSFMKISMDQAKCTSCHICEYKCKAGCIDSNNKKVDLTRCISCFNCLDICPHKAINYSFIKKSNKENIDYSRRKFLKYLFPFTLLSFTLLGALIRKSVLGKRNTSKIPISPPGSLSINSYLDLCTACHTCVNSCPTKVLRPAGFLNTMQPTLDYSYAFCDFECNICSRVCPSGAIKLLTLEKKKKTQIGEVNLNKNHCVVYEYGLDCGACAEHCPTAAVYMIPYKNNIYGPETNSNICIGCGACEYICPAVPKKAITVQGNKIHKIVKDSLKEGLKDESQGKKVEEKPAKEDFPF